MALSSEPEVTATVMLIVPMFAPVAVFQYVCCAPTDTAGAAANAKEASKGVIRNIAKIRVVESMIQKM